MSSKSLPVTDISKMTSIFDNASIACTHYIYFLKLFIIKIGHYELHMYMDDQNDNIYVYMGF